MSTKVAQIDQITADNLLVDPDYIIDVVQHKYGFPCIHEQDALELLQSSDYAMVAWEPYFVGDLEIGIPLPRKSRT